MISKEFSKLVKSFADKEEASATSWIFRMMNFSAFMGVLSCIICTAHKYIGDNINCITGFSGQEHRAVETYCFISSIFTMVNVSQNDVPHYGIGIYNPHTANDVQMHTFYQWVPIFLGLQSALYYLPWWMWTKLFDKGRFSKIIGNLDSVQLAGVEKDGPDHVEVSVTYMYQTINTHTGYALVFLMCECIAFGSALGNIFLTNAFLGGNFWSFGSDALTYITGDITDMDNALNQVFPKVTKCLWYKYGPTGTINNHDALCVLPLNIVNEKTFIVLWLVYIVTFAVVSLLLLIHIILMLSPTLRELVTRQRVKGDFEKSSYDNVSRKCNYGDWFMVDQLGCQMVDIYFASWIKKLEEMLNR